MRQVVSTPHVPTAGPLWIQTALPSCAARFLSVAFCAFLDLRVQIARDRTHCVICNTQFQLGLVPYIKPLNHEQNLLHLRSDSETATRSQSALYLLTNSMEYYEIPHSFPLLDPQSIPLGSAISVEK